MARIARVVAEHYPHHITQRGNRRQDTFFCDEDYIQLMAEWCGKYSVEIWAYCLMPNHVHLIAVPDCAERLCRAIGEAHRRYTRQINFRENVNGKVKVYQFWENKNVPPLMLNALFMMTGRSRNHLLAGCKSVC